MAKGCLLKARSIGGGPDVWGNQHNFMSLTKVVRYLIKITGEVPVIVYLIIYYCGFLIMLSDNFFDPNPFIR